VGAAGTDTGGSDGSSSPTTVIQDRPSRRPRTIRGMTMSEETCEDGSGSKVKEPNAIGPLPGTWSGSSMSAWRHHWLHWR